MTSAAAWLSARERERNALLERVIGALRDEPGVGGAWLLGSLGRGTADAWSDVDVCVVARDEASATIIARCRELVARPAAPLLIQELPRNAPPGGAYLLALYPGASGPLQVDWYLRPRAGAVVPHDACLLFDDVGLPFAPPPPPMDAPARADACLRDTLFFWAMAPIAAKYIGRGHPGRAFDLLRAMAGALERVRLTALAPDLVNSVNSVSPVNPAGELWPGLLIADPGAQLAALRQLCRTMAALLPHLGHLDGAGGRMLPETLPQLDRLLDAVVALVPASVDRDEGTTPRVPAAS